MLPAEIAGVAVVTGAASGIGQETAFEFAEVGALGVVFADLNEKAARASAQKSEEFAKHPEYRAIPVAVDVTDPASVQAMVDTAIREFGRIDYGVNCAGIGPASRNTIAEASLAEYGKMFDVNLMGTVLCMGAVSKAMMKQEPRTITSRNGTRSIGRGSIVNIASANAYVAEPGKAPYIASKFAVIGVTKTAALENAPHGIRVNALCPGPVDTPMMQTDIKMAPFLKEAIAKFTPMGRMALPEEMAQVILFLCGPGGSYVSGTGLIVDGGITLALHTG